MRLKKLLITILMFSFVGAVFAETEITGSSKSEHEETIFSHNMVEISNVDEDGNTLKDSEFQIQDSEGTIVYEFKMPNENFIVERLEEGTYFLVQVTAPKGYELNSNKIKFEIKKSVVNLEVKNKKIVNNEVGMTSGNTILLFMAMLNITIGLGILGYVKREKNKK